MVGFTVQLESRVSCAIHCEGQVDVIKCHEAILNHLIDIVEEHRDIIGTERESSHKSVLSCFECSAYLCLAGKRCQLIRLVLQHTTLKSIKCALVACLQIITLVGAEAV